MPINNQYSYLIVNADDYGYFDFVSKGILTAAKEGIVTATGVMANSPSLSEHISWLGAVPELDVGVHLNLTSGRPLSAEMGKVLVQNEGRKFPDKFSLVKSIFRGGIKIEHVEVEWRAQIDKCIAEGLKIQFLNSHEHIHMLPELFKLVTLLAEEYEIDHIRLSSPELFAKFSGSGLVRDSIMSILSLANRKQTKRPMAKFLGMGQSGKLDLTYLKKCIVKMKRGQVYELMCHPGDYNNEEIESDSLMSYHAWRGEFDALVDSSIPDFLIENDVKLISYRDLDLNGNQLNLCGKGGSE